MIPKIQYKAKSLIHEMYHTESKKKALEVYDHFLAIYGEKYPKAIECLIKDVRGFIHLLWFSGCTRIHIRLPTNPIEPIFAAVRLGTKRTKGCGSYKVTLCKVFKFVQGGTKKLAEA